MAYTHRRSRSSVSLFLMAAVLLAASAMSATSASAQQTSKRPQVEVNGFTCTIVGTEGNDVLTGTEGDDVICGLGGDDIINGLGGNDVINGDDGNDIISAGPGADKLFGGDGSDALVGEDGSDYLDGGEGNDNLNGGNGNDLLTDGLGDDFAFGGPGADKLFGGSGADALKGEDGNDYLDGGDGSDSVDGGGGVDYCDINRADTTVSCFNDSKLPTLISIRVSPSSVNTATGPAEVKVRLRIKDIGAGIAGFCVEGEMLNPAGVDCTEWRIYLSFNSGRLEASYGLDMRSCDANGFLPAAPEVTSSAKGGRVGLLCRISGTANDGVYEGTFQLTATKRAMYRLSTVFIIDDAGNRNSYGPERLAEKKLNVSFTQSNAGDKTPPVLVSVSFTPGSVDSSAAPQIANIRVRIKDKGSGVCVPTCEEAREGIGGSVFSRGASPVQIPIKSFTRTSGSANDGIYEGTINVRQGTQSGKFYLDYLDFEDASKNNTTLDAEDFKKRKLVVSLRQSGVGDGKKPKIQSIRLSSPEVDAASDSQRITVDIRVADNRGLFMPSSAEVGATDIRESTIGGTFTSADGKRDIRFFITSLQEDCSTVLAVNQTACRVSGDVTDGVYRTVIVIPKNSGKGRYSLTSAGALDDAQNDLRIEGAAKLATAGITASFVVR